MTQASPVARLPAAERDQVEACVRLFGDVLGDAVVGAYLFGSAVSAGLRVDSDLDLLVITRRRTTEAERRSLIDGLLSLSRTRGDDSEKRHLEVTVVAGSDIRPWRYPPPMELQYGDWWRTEFEAGVAQPWISPNPDLAVLLTAARADSVPLAGPTLDEVVDRIPRADLNRALRDVIPSLVADLDDDVRNVLLTLARVWYTLDTGTIGAKDVAAEWAIARLPPGRGEALRLARAAYLGETHDSWTGAAMVAARADANEILEAISAQHR